MVAPLPNVTTCGKDSASREQNKINQFVFYAKAKPILSKFKQLYDMLVIPLAESLVKFPLAS